MTLSAATARPATLPKTTTGCACFLKAFPRPPVDADIQRIRALGGENDSASRELARYIHSVGETYDFGAFTPKLIFRRDRYLRGGDHSAFNEQGFAAVRFTEYREDYNHQHQNVRTENGIEYGDLPKFVDFDYVANVARLNAATLASLASSPAPPSEVHILTKQLENDSKIQWKPAPGATAYEVLWRKTTDADFPEENLQRTTEPKVDLTGLQGQCDFWSTISRCQGPQKPDSDS